MSDKLPESIQNVPQSISSIERAQVHPERYYWRMPADKPYTENPKNCFQRTLEATETTFEFTGQKTPLENTSAVFLTPTYYKEWQQGNIQSQLFELLTHDYSEGKDNIEIVYLLNNLEHETMPDDREKMDTFLSQFPLKMGVSPPPSPSPNLNRPTPSNRNRDEYDDYDFSQMTERQFVKFKQLIFGERIPYPDYLYRYKPDIAQDIVRKNIEIVGLFKDIAEMQSLGRIDTSANQLTYRKVQDKMIEVLDKYTDNKELQEIVRLSFAQARHVNISLIDLLHTDFTQEGYNEKGIASIRTVGMDYARERYPNSPHMIVQPLDGDELPSPTYVKKLREYYEETGLECTQVPYTTMALPGLTKNLTETGIDQSIVQTRFETFPPRVTRNQSMTSELAKEFDSVKGLSGVDIDEDFFLKRIMEKFAVTVGGEKYSQLHEFPSIAICMIDREGWVDGAARGEAVVSGDTIYAELTDPKYKRYLNEVEYNKWKDGWKNPSSIPLPEFRVIEQKFRKYLKTYYDEICVPQSERNRFLFMALSDLRAKGDLVKVGEKFEIKNWDSVPADEIFDVAHFINHNSSLLSDIVEDDWEYINYLLFSNSNTVRGVGKQKLTKFQLSLREYLGVPLTPDRIINSQFNIAPGEDRGPLNKDSQVFASIAFKLAFNLCEENFLRRKINLAETDHSARPIEPTYDVYESRVQGIRLAINNQDVPNSPSVLTNTR